MDWMPIETAPRDGTIVLGFCERLNCVGEIMWFDHFGKWGETWVIAGFNQPWASRPTHWMPLPPPPNSAKVAEGESE